MRPMLSTQSIRRFVAMGLCAGLLMAVPATVPAVASTAKSPQAHSSIRSKKYCDAYYKKLRKTNSPKVAKFLAQLRGCVFKTTKKHR